MYRFRTTSRAVLVFACFTFAGIFNANAQAPQGINYQAVARTADGTPHADTTLDVSITIADDITLATVVFSEVHSVTTNRFGLFTLVIGDGTPTQATLQDVDWSSNSKFLNVQIGSIDMGTTQLMSVPYALYAERAGNTYSIDSSLVNGTDLILYNETDSTVIDLSTLVLSGNDTISVFDIVGDSLRIIENTDTFYVNISSLATTIDVADAAALLNTRIDSNANEILAQNLQISINQDSIAILNNRADSISNAAQLNTTNIALQQAQIDINQDSIGFLEIRADSISNAAQLNTANIALQQAQIDINQDSIGFLEIRTDSISNAAQLNTANIALQQAQIDINQDSIGFLEIRADSISNAAQLNTANIALQQAQIDINQDSIGFLEIRADSISNAAQLNTANIALQQAQIDINQDSIGFLEIRADSISNAAQLNTANILLQQAQIDINQDSIGFLEIRADSISNAAQLNTANIALQQAQIDINQDSIGFLEIRADSISNAAQLNTANILLQQAQIDINQDSIGFLEIRADSISNAAQLNTANILLQQAQIDINQDSIWTLDSLLSDHILNDEDTDSTNERINSVAYDSIANTLTIIENDSTFIVNLSGLGEDSTRIGLNTTKVYVDPIDSNVVIVIEGVEAYRIMDDRIQVTENGLQNLAFGNNALATNTTGFSNTAFGDNALSQVDTMFANTAFGANALSSNVSKENTAVGANALSANTTGERNDALGNQALSNNQTGSGNIAVGWRALGELLVSGNENTALGFRALAQNNGDNNTAVGAWAGDNSTGSNNVFIGRFAGYSETLSDKLYIENSSSTVPLIWGDFASDIVQVNGAFRTAIGDTLYYPTSDGASGWVLQSNGNGVLTFADPNGLVASDTINAIALINDSTLVLVDQTNDTLFADLSALATDAELANQITALSTLLNAALNAEIAARQADSASFSTAISANSANIITNSNNLANHIANDLDTVATNELITDAFILGDSLYIIEGGDTTFASLVGLNSDTLPLIRSLDSTAYVSTLTPGEVNIGLNDTARYTFLENRIETKQASVYIGTGAGQNDPIPYADSISNVAIGYHALQVNNGNYGTVAIGAEALASNGLNGPDNTAVGNQAMKNNFNGANNTAIGKAAMKNAVNPNGNTSVGKNSLSSFTSGNGNTAIGDASGQGLTNGGGNVFVGSSAGEVGAYSNRLYINNGSSPTPLIFGDFAADSVAINGKLNVNGNYTFPTSDGTTGQVMITDGSGNLSFSSAAADNLGNHALDTNLITGDRYISSDGDDEGIRIDTAGRIGIGMTPNSDYLLRVNGKAIFYPGSGKNVEVNGYGSGFRVWDGDSLLRYASIRSNDGGPGYSARLDLSTPRGQFTIATPGESFSNGDDTTKIYGSGDLWMVTGITGMPTLSSTYDQKVGVRTAIPRAPLEVVASNVDSDFIQNGIIIENNAAGAAQNAIMTARTGATSGSPAYALDINNKGGYSMGMNQVDTTLNFYNLPDPGGATIMTFKLNNNVGIGTTNPQSKLDVGGNIRAQGLTVNSNYTLPTNAPALNQVMKYDGTNLVWANDSVGAGSSEDSTRIANAANDTRVSITNTTTDSVNMVIDGINSYTFTPNNISFNNPDGLVFVGRGAGGGVDTTTGNSIYSVFVGENAGGFVNKGAYSSYGQTGIGSGVLSSLTPGGTYYYNTGIGFNVLSGLQTGGFNTVIGSGAMGAHSNASSNTAIGYATFSQGSGNSNVMIGFYTGLEADGNNNTYIGNQAGDTATGDFNTYIGYLAGSNTNVGSRNVFIGKEAGQGWNQSDRLIIENSASAFPLLYGEFDNDIIQVNGSFKTSDGIDTLIYPTSDGTAGQVLMTDGNGLLSFQPNGAVGDDSTRIGFASSRVYIDPSDSNVVIEIQGTEEFRFYSGRINTGNGPVYMGRDAGLSDSLVATSNGNVGIGYKALENATGSVSGSGSSNVAVGSLALSLNTTGSENTAVGTSSMSNTTTGSFNTALGQSAMSNANGSGNTAIGRYAMRDNSSGGGNLAIGEETMVTNTSGNNNTMLGTQSGIVNTGSGNVFIGYRAGFNTTNSSDQLYISNSSDTTPLVYGEFNNDILQINGTFKTSDGIDTLTYPSSDGTAGQVLVTDGNGNLTFAGGGSNDTVGIQFVLGKGSNAGGDSIFNISYFNADTGNINLLEVDTSQINILRVNKTAYVDTLLIGPIGYVGKVSITTTDTVGQFTILNGINANRSFAAGFKNLDSGTGNKYGVYAEALGNNSNDNFGLVGHAANASTSNVGLSGQAESSVGNLGIGIYGNASGAGTNYAGYFDQGNVYVNNNLGIGVPSPISLLHVAGGGRFDSLIVDGLYTFPTAAPTVSGQVIKYNGTNLVWANDSVGNTATPGLDLVLAQNNSALSDTAYLGGLSVGTTAANTALINANDNTREISIEVNNATSVTSPNLSKGVFANVTGGGSGSKYAIFGETSNNAGTKYGVFGSASGNGGTKYGIYGTASGTGLANYAGYFDNGNVYVNNNLGIGVASPLRRLEVGGDAYIDSIWTDSLVIGSGVNGFSIAGSPGLNGDVLTYNNGSAIWSAASGDNLGNHILDTNLMTNGRWLSNDGDGEGIFINSIGKVGVGNPSPIGRFDVLDTVGGNGIRVRSLGASAAVNRGITVSASNSTSENRAIQATAGAAPLSMGLASYADAVSTGQNYGVYGLAGNSTNRNVGVFGNTYGTVALDDAAVWALAEGSGRSTAVLADAIDTSNTSIVNTAILARASGADTNYAAYFESGAVYVGDSLIIPNGASSGYVLTSDATGNASWQPAAGGGGNDNDWDTTLTSVYTTKNVGIGTSTPSTGFELADSTGWPELKIRTGVNGNSFSYVSFETPVYSETVSPTRNNALWQMGLAQDGASSQASDRWYVGRGGIAGSTSDLTVNRDGKVGIGTNTPVAQLGIESIDPYGLDVVMTGANSGNNFGVSVIHSQASTQTNVGVYSEMNGAATTNKGFETVVRGGFTNFGLNADAIDPGASQNFGVRALADSSLANYAISGNTGSIIGGAGYAVFGNATGPGVNYAGYFENGAVYIQDSLILPNGAFAGYVLTTDAAGNASWQPSAGGSGDDNDWDTTLTSVYTNKSVGIGTATPYGILSIEDTLSDLSRKSGVFYNSYTINNLDTASGIHSAMSGDAQRMFGFYSELEGSMADFSKTYGIMSTVVGADTGTNPDYFGGFFSASGTNNGAEYFGIRTEATGTGASSENIGIWASASGATTNYAGYFDNGDVQINNRLAVGGFGAGFSEILNVQGGIVADSIQLTDGAANGYVLTSDALGNATWQAPGAGGMDSDWDTLGNFVYNNLDTIVIGDTLIGIGRFNVLTDDAIGAVISLNGNNGASNTNAMFVFNSDKGTAENTALQTIANSPTASENYGIRSFADSSIFNVGIVASGGSFLLPINEESYGVLATGTSSTGIAYGTQNIAGSNSGVAYGSHNTASSISDTAIGVFATAASVTGRAYAGYFDAGFVQINDTLILPNGASNGYVLTSDANGKATWQPSSGGGSDLATTLGLGSDAGLDSIYNLHFLDADLSFIDTSSTDYIQLGAYSNLFGYNDGTDSGAVYLTNINDNFQFTNDGPASVIGQFQNGLQFFAVDSAAAGTTLNLATQDYTSLNVKLSGVGINVDNANAPLEVGSKYDSLAVYISKGDASPGSPVIGLRDSDNSNHVGIAAADVVLNNYKIVLPDTAPLNGQIMSFNSALSRMEWVNGGSSSTCPLGFTSVNGTFCIETAARTGDNWFDAADTCSAIDAKLPTWSEWYTGVQVAGVDWAASPQWEWIDQASQNNASIAGGGGGAAPVARKTISADNPITPSNTVQYRCVYRIK